MPNPDEAREEAQRDYLRTYESVKTLQGALDFGWAARGRYDEQRLAALQGILTAWRMVEDTAHYGGEVRDEAERLLRQSISIARALGQSEGVEP